MKGKNYLYIIIIVLLVIIIAFLGYKLVEKNDEQISNNLPSENIQVNKLSDENQNTNLGDTQSTNQSRFSETKNYDIELNDNTAKIEVGMKIYEGYIKISDKLKEQRIYLEIGVNEKQVTLEKGTIYPIIGMNKKIEINDIIEEISTIKGQDNKSYITMTFVRPDWYAHDDKYCYVIDEDGNVLGVFNYDIGGSVQVEDYSGGYLDVQEDCIIQYDMNIEDLEENGVTLDKWKYTIKDGKIEKELVKQYTKDEFTGAGKKK